MRETVRAQGDAVERVTNDGQVVAPSFGEEQPLAFAMEQLQPKFILKGFQLVAHSTRRDVQFLSGARAAFAAGRSLKRFQAIQWRETTRHRSGR